MKIIQEHRYTLKEAKEEKKKEKTTNKKIVILTTRNTDDPDPKIVYFETVKALVDIMEERGIEYYVLFTENAFVTNEDGVITIYNVDDKKGMVISPKNTIVINRNTTGGGLGSSGITIQLEKNNFTCINSKECIDTCSDKYRTCLRLAEKGIPVPRTLLIQDELTFDRLKGEIKYPVVVKTLTGSQGIGVFISESAMNLKSVLQAIWSIDDGVEVLLQDFIEADGDIRAWFIENELIAAMKRVKIDGDFRSNFSLGGKTEKVIMTPEQLAICKKVVRIVDGKLLGIDLMINEKGEPFVLEVNSSPGTTGITEASGVPVAEKIVDYLMSL
jgi:gamma-F420-2:alpha-L-glutamate ligase